MAYRKRLGSFRGRSVKFRKLGVFRSRKAMAVLRNLSKRRRVVKLGKPVKRGNRVMWPVSVDGRYR